MASRTLYTLHFPSKDAHAEDVTETGRSYLPNTSAVVPCLSPDLLLLLPVLLFLLVDLLLPISLVLLLLPLSLLLLLLLLMLLLLLLLVPVSPSMLLLVSDSLMRSLLSFMPLLAVSWSMLLLIADMACDGSRWGKLCKRWCKLA